jgi:uncharacterized protein
VVGADAGRSVVLHISGGDCDVLSAQGWQGVRRIELAMFAGGGIALEDTDPFRRCHHWDVAQRLSDANAARWSRAIPAAWDLLAQDHHSYAPAIAAGLSTIVPLAPSLSGRAVSSTARRAYGAIGAALPVRRTGTGNNGAHPSASALALLIIHEFQHGKLGAVLDMADLHDPHDTRLFEAPWREDPRPLEGLLQGTYAHVGRGARARRSGVRTVVRTHPACHARPRRLRFPDAPRAPLRGRPPDHLGRLDVQGLTAARNVDATDHAAQSFRRRSVKS